MLEGSILLVVYLVLGVERLAIKKAITSPDRTGSKVYYQSGNVQVFYGQLVAAHAHCTNYGCSACLKPVIILLQHLFSLHLFSIIAHRGSVRVQQYGLVPVSFLMGGVDIGRRRAATPPWPGLVPVRAGLVIDFCTSPVRTGNSTYKEYGSV